MPRQVRKPCSGCGRRVSTAMISALSVLGPIARALALEALGVPFGIQPVRARHVVGQCAMPWAAIAPGVCRNTLTAVEHLHRALGGQPCLNLLADQGGLRDGVEEPSDLDVIVDANPGKRPFGVLVIGVGQRSHHRAFDRLEQLPPADPETAHHPPVQLHQNLGDRRVAFGEREELQVAQSRGPAGRTERCGTPASTFALSFRMIRPCWQNADTVMCRHGAVAAIDLGTHMNEALCTPLLLRLSGTSRRGLAPQNRNIRTCAPIQSGKPSCVQVASA